METKAALNYSRIAGAIGYIKENFRSQPDLDEVADHIHLSPEHFQRLFTDWAGTSPKKFLQYLSVEHAKRLLLQEHATLFDTAYDTGLSSTSRLHDLFISIEGMSPAEYKHGGRNLTIRYRIADSPFGPVIVASTSKGICHLAFVEDMEKAVGDLTGRFPEACLQEESDLMQARALAVFQHDRDYSGDPGHEHGLDHLHQIKLHLKGTDFQLKVWESLLKIPRGGLSTYGHIARHIGSSGASRAVGTAIGSNPVAFLIPCHRVIRSTGIFGEYMWGSTRKAAMIGWEGARTGATEGIL